MQTNREITPCYLATSRGFYCHNKLPKDCEEGVILFTSNIRRARAFASFAEAEGCFKQLAAVKANTAGSFPSSKKAQAVCSDYFAILVISTFSIPSKEQQP